MTDVYLRYAGEAYGKKIGEVPFSANGIDEVVRLVKEWGVYVDGQDMENFNSAQFRVTESGAYFEIVLGED